MQEIENMKNLFDLFYKDATKFIEKQNHAAGIRARHASKALETAMRTWRVDSLSK